MKKYRQLVKELPSKKVVFAFGSFQPPTIGHELLVNAVKKIASIQKADHAIFASGTQDKKSNPLPVDRKLYYLKRMFPKTNFVAANEEVRTFVEAAKMLSKKYKNLVMVAGSNRVPEFKKLLEKYNGDLFKFDTIEVVSAGERDPDADGAPGMSGLKMKDAAKKGDFKLFKKGLPHTLTELDGKRLMNEIRVGMGIEIVKEHVKFETNELREKYYAGKIFNIGDNVTDGTSIFEVVDRGSNYITVVNEHGDMSKKWLTAVQPIEIKEDIQPGPAPKELSYKGYTTKNFHHSADAAKAFQDTIVRADTHKHDPVAILNALKATDVYMGLNDKHLTGEEFTDSEKDTWIAAHEKAREYLNKVGEFMHHEDYWHMHQHELEGVLSPFHETGKGEFMEEKLKIKADEKISSAKMGSSLGANSDSHRHMKIKYRLGEQQGTEDTFEQSKDTIDPESDDLLSLNDKSIDDMINGMSDDDYLEAYDDDELSIIDDETGEHIAHIKEDVIMEVLSRAERIRAKIRFAKSEAKRERRTRIALKTHSNTATINKRARKLAIDIMKKRLANKPLDKLSVSEKERIEATIAKRKNVVNRIAMRLVARVKKTENDRLSHQSYTK